MMGYSTQVAVRFETGQTTVILVEALQSLGDPAVYLIQSYDDNMFALKIKLSSCSYVPHLDWTAALLSGWAFNTRLSIASSQSTVLLQVLKHHCSLANLCLRFIFTFVNVILSLLQIHHSCSLVP